MDRRLSVRDQYYPLVGASIFIQQLPGQIQRLLDISAVVELISVSEGQVFFLDYPGESGEAYDVETVPGVLTSDKGIKGNSRSFGSTEVAPHCH